MEKQKWARVKPIVDELLTLGETERKEQIEAVCDYDDVLITQVTEQLRYIKASEDSNFLNSLEEDRQTFLDNLEAKPFLRQDELIGQRFGAFKITGQLGSGGMGSVYKAERVDEAFHQTVAIKVINQNLKSEETFYRFNNEREILARLNHAHIARLYDGGLSQDGTPFLVMEYVDGMPIDQWCAEHQCDVEQKLELFNNVCNAVQYANTNMVIHRDLKPQNILVNREGEVKILDFGIAKLKDTHIALHETQAGRRLWTPQYAAPEQVLGNEVDTTADVYALGGLLYTLLTGCKPYNFSNKSTYEIESIIKEDDPTTPSKRVLSQPAKSAKAREKLSKALHGDIDAIIMKALRKESNERYKSVGHLMDDLERYKAHQAVGARLDSTRYRVSKFYERHKKRDEYCCRRPFYYYYIGYFLHLSPDRAAQ